jgi:hypothetical protein
MDLVYMSGEEGLIGRSYNLFNLESLHRINSVYVALSCLHVKFNIHALA